MKRLINQEGISWVESTKDAISNDGQTITLDGDLQVNGSISGDEILNSLTVSAYNDFKTTTNFKPTVSFVKCSLVNNVLSISFGGIIEVLNSGSHSADELNKTIIYITLPADILNKITANENLNYVAINQIGMMRNISEYVPFTIACQKQSSASQLAFALRNYSGASLTQSPGQPYMFRYELNLNLNKNLIS